MIILSRFCLQKCMSHTTVFYKAKPKAHTYMYSLRSSCFIKSQHSTSQETLLWSWNSRSKAYLVTLAKIQDTQGHEVATSHSSCILSLDLIGQHQSKKFYVTDIVLLLRFIDIIFRRERSDNWKYICCSPGTLHATWLIPLSATTATECDKKAEAMQICELLKYCTR